MTKTPMGSTIGTMLLKVSLYRRKTVTPSTFALALKGR
jgi:hypothetical protein